MPKFYTDETPVNYSCYPAYAPLKFTHTHTHTYLGNIGVWHIVSKLIYRYGQLQLGDL